MFKPASHNPALRLPRKQISARISRFKSGRWRTMLLENIVQRDDPTEESRYIPPLLDCLVIVHFGERYHSCDGMYWHDQYLEEKICERAEAYRGKPIYILETSDDQNICPRLVNLLGKGFTRIPFKRSFDAQFRKVAKIIKKNGHRSVEIGGIAANVCVRNLYDECKKQEDLEPLINPLLTFRWYEIHKSEDFLSSLNEWFWDEGCSLLTKEQVLTYREEISQFIMGRSFQPSGWKK